MEKTLQKIRAHAEQLAFDTHDHSEKGAGSFTFYKKTKDGGAETMFVVHPFASGMPAKDSEGRIGTSDTIVVDAEGVLAGTKAPPAVYLIGRKAVNDYITRLVQPAGVAIAEA